MALFPFNARMFTDTYLFIGVRYIKSKRRNQFISFIAGFSLLGMALGTLALIVVLSVMNGFDREIKQRILQVVPHGFIDKPGGLESWKTLGQQVIDVSGVQAVAPYIGGYGMLSSARGIQGSQIQAVLPDQEVKVSAVNEFIYSGSWQNLQAGEFGIILGHFLARFLQVGVGDRVVMTLPDISITPVGIFPRAKRFKVVGIFAVGAQVDQNLALIHVADAQKLFRYGQSVQGVRVQVENIFDVTTTMARVQQQLGTQYTFKNWTQTQGNLFQAIQLEKRMVTLLLLIIIAVAALNIITGLVLMVADKRGDIAVLRTLGMKSRDIMAIFIAQGTITGVVGVLIGAILGCLLAYFISDFIAWIESLLGMYIFDPNVYFISEVPSELRFEDVVFIGSAGVVMSILATIYPAYCAAQVEPAEVLKYE